MKIMYVFSMFAVVSLPILVGCDDSENSSNDNSNSAENTETLCTDEIDNDGDGVTDCDDDECRQICEDLHLLSCGVPKTFEWTSSDPLISPPEGSASIKDPSVLFYNDAWQIYATHYSEEDGYSMVYLSFTDWDKADEAEKIPVSINPNLTGYKCAPQFFYFAEQDLWYLIYQTQEPAYSTTKDPTDVESWSKSTRFMPMPDIIENSDWGGIDYWVICDDDNCYMFFSADNGVLYRAKTPKSDFPNGFEGTTEIVMEDNKNALFEAANVYKIQGEDKYLLIVEAIGLGGRYFRSFTADRLDGEWTPLRDTQDEPFASMSNVTGADWSNDGISHGEMLRYNPDETMTIDTCNMQYLFQGRTAVGSEYNLNEYSLGLLTDTVSRPE